MRFENRKRMIMALVIACQLCLLVSTPPLQAENTAPLETNIKEQKDSPVGEEPEGVEGKAYYYAKHYNKGPVSGRSMTRGS
jgi:hypothetical protein